MRRFKFRLEPVKRLRQHEERSAQLQVAQELQALSRLAVARVETLRELSRIEQMISDGASSQALQSTVVSYKLTCDHLDQLDQLIVEQEQRLEDARQRYFDAHRQTETLVRLEEKAKARHNADQLREEQQIVDEVVLARSGR